MLDPHVKIPLVEELHIAYQDINDLSYIKTVTWFESGRNVNELSQQKSKLIKIKFSGRLKESYRDSMQIDFSNIWCVQKE